MASETLHFLLKILASQAGAQPSSGMLGPKGLDNIDIQLGNGTADGVSVDRMAQADITVPPAGNLDVNLRTLPGFNAVAQNFADGVLLVLEHISGDEVIYGPNAANGLEVAGFFKTPSDTTGFSRLSIKTGGLLVLGYLTGAGLAMDATHSSLNFADAAAAGASLRLTIIGRSV